MPYLNKQGPNKVHKTRWLHRRRSIKKAWNQQLCSLCCPCFFLLTAMIKLWLRVCEGWSRPRGLNHDHKQHHHHHHQRAAWHDHHHHQSRHKPFPKMIPIYRTCRALRHRGFPQLKQNSAPAQATAFATAAATKLRTDLGRLWPDRTCESDTIITVYINAVLCHDKV